MKRRLKIAISLALCTCMLYAANVGFADTYLEFNDAAGNFYNYCPSYVQISDTVRYMYYCKNRDSGTVVDYIYWRKATKSGSTWTWGAQNIALYPGANGWDRIHACDPDVKRGSFLYNNHTYSWIMFYLGCDQLDNNHNQIGIAFADSPEGPWVKWSGNPLITASTSVWGVGQASATCVDGVGRMLLFYTRGDANGTRICRRDINLANMSSYSLGTELNVFTNGLTEKDGSNVVFHNAGFAYDGATDRFYTVRERHPFEANQPTFIASDLQIAYTAGANIWNNSGTWTVDGHVTPTNTGKSRNHNGTLLTNVWGGLIGGATGYQVEYTMSDIGASSLWTYKIYAIHKPDLTNVNKVDGMNRAIQYTGTWYDGFGDTTIYYQGTEKYCTTYGPEAEFTFKGTAIHYYGSKASNNGKANIYIDGVFQTTLDTYSPTWIKSCWLYSKTGLTYGTHTIRIEVIQDKHPSSTGYNKGIDYFMIE